MSASRNPFITIWRLGSGYAAVMLAEYEDMEWGLDVVNTGFGRYRTYKEAESEARSWAAAEEIPLKLRVV